MTNLVKNLFSIIISFSVVLTIQFALAQHKDFTLEEIFLSDKFIPERMIGIQWMRDGERYTFIKRDAETDQQNIIVRSIKEGTESILVSGKDLIHPDTKRPIRINEYSWSPNERKLLVATNRKQIWRYSWSADFYLFHVEDKWVRSISQKPGEVMNVKFSPNGKYVGFVRDNEIYYYDIENKQEIQLSFTAKEKIYNGRFGWVYEEEFAIADGWRWSPDSRSIAYWHEDESPVQLFNLVDYMPLYPEETFLPYPKAGDDNPIVKIGVVDLGTKETTWIDIGDETDQYIPRIAWTNDPNLLTIQRLNRQQNHLEYLIADVSTGKTRVIFEERSPGWIDIHDNLIFLNNENQFIWASNRDGWNHLYLYDYDGNVIRQITKGEWEVVDILELDEENNYIFYTSNEVSHRETHLYRSNLDETGKVRLTKERGVHSINMSPTGAYYIDTFSNTRTPSQVYKFDRDGNEIRHIINNTLEPYEDYRISFPESGSFTTTDGIELDYKITYPPDFDSSNKYPVIFSIYGGPGSQRVRDTWINLWEQHLAQKGFIIFTMDPRGTGGRGRDFLFKTYKELGVWEVNDFVEGAKYLATYDFVDTDRIGIWGWSYGGYLAILTLLLGADHFTTGVSVAPVTDWRFYDTIYTERYMLRPQDNPEGYDAGSCIVHADSLRGNLLIVHGAMDDNVHLQQTYHMIDALQSLNKRFDMHIYPRGNHRMGDGVTRLHFYTMFTDYFIDNL